MQINSYNVPAILSGTQVTTITAALMRDVITYNMADVVGVSEVLLCPYRYLKDVMVNSKNSKFNSASTPGS